MLFKEQRIELRRLAFLRANRSEIEDGEDEMFYQVAPLCALKDSRVVFGTCNSNFLRHRGSTSNSPGSNQALKKVGEMRENMFLLI